MPLNVPDKLTQLWRSQVAQDPGLPVSNPTTSYWQIPPHALSNIQSETLPVKTDYAIIGSGITGLSLAKHILEHPQSANSNVTVFEARTLCSGASGRNAGGLASRAPYAFSSMVEEMGEKHAIEIAKFQFQTLEKLYELANADDELKYTSEIRRVRDLETFLDLETFEASRESFELMERLVPEAGLQLEVLSPEVALRDFGIETVGGILRFNTGALWPYRFVTTLWERLWERFGGSRLAIETKTPVTSIDVDSSDTEYPYVLSTPRGVTRARFLIHATNGYAGHLLPSIRGKLFPNKAYYMSAQQPGPTFGSYGRDRSWSWFGAMHLDGNGKPKNASLTYGNQSPGGGVVFWGTDKVPLEEWVSVDDSIVPQETRGELESALPRFFSDEEAKVRNVWTGIQGWTADEYPLVGRLPDSCTGRVGVGREYIAAGFNGAGLCQCWSAGEAVVEMMFGEEVERVLPRVYHVSEERLGKMSADDAVQVLVDS